MRTRVAAPLLSLLVVAACSSGSPDDPSPSRRPAQTPSASASTSPPSISRGWSVFSVDGFELALPDRFEGGDVDEVLRALEDAEGAIADQAREGLAVIRAMDAFRLFAFDARAKPGEYVTNVSILEAPPLGIDVEQQLALTMEYYEEQLTGFDVVEGEVVSLGGRDVAHLVVDSEFPFGTVRQFHYHVLDGGSVWFVNYAALASEAELWRPLFEDSAGTIRLG